MVDYENRQPPEGINLGGVHPLRSFATLLVAAAVLVTGLVVVAQFAGAFAARLVPFATERRVVQGLDIAFGDAPADDPMRMYLNALAVRLAPGLDLPHGMILSVHYQRSDTVNAFATLGGNLLFYRGLLERLPSENALATVMAHEMAHVLHRDPVAGLGGGVASALVLSAITGSVGTGAAGDALSRTGLLTGVQFTRRMEARADRAAAVAVAGLYGHLNGAGTLFETLAETRSASHDRPGTPRWLERFVATHPLDEDRVETIAARARELRVPVTGPLTPLPDGFEDWLQAAPD